jgi:hypothetical protein
MGGLFGGPSGSPPPPPPPLPPPPNMSSADVQAASANVRARAAATGSMGNTNPTGASGVENGTLDRKSLLGQ